jgi:hypothetical protein
MNPLVVSYPNGVDGFESVRGLSAAEIVERAEPRM